MLRLMLTEELWRRLEPRVVEAGAYRLGSLRSRLEAILWKLRTGAPWRDLPTELGSWSSAYNQFNRWSSKGLWERIFLLIRGELDDEWNFMDGTIVRAHQHSSGARKGESTAIGKSRGGLSTKVHMLADAHGNPIHFAITEGQAHEMTKAFELLETCQAETLINDKAYDSMAFRKKSAEKGTTAIIPRLSNRADQQNPDFDAFLYRHRHLVENLFARLKHFRSIATRYEKLARNYGAILFLGSILIWLHL